jgi:hypothetical protein
MADVIPLNLHVGLLADVFRQWPPGHALIVTTAASGTKTQGTVVIDNNAKTVTVALT